MRTSKKDENSMKIKIEMLSRKKQNRYLSIILAETLQKIIHFLLLLTRIPMALFQSQSGQMSFLEISMSKNMKSLIFTTFSSKTHQTYVRTLSKRLNLTSKMLKNLKMTLNLTKKRRQSIDLMMV